MKTLLYSAMTVLVLSCSVPAWAADELTVNGMRGADGAFSSFAQGYVTGVLHVYWTQQSLLPACNSLFSPATIVALIDVRPLRYEKDHPLTAIQNVLISVGCAMRIPPAPTVSQ